jgi:arylformamidase
MPPQPMPAPTNFLLKASASELDVLYNNRLRVPQFADIVASWQRRSAECRAQARHTGSVRLDVPYTQSEVMPNATLDLFQPAASRPGAVLLFIHGGYWRSLDKADHSFVAQPFVEAGFPVAVPNYALCPGTAARPVGIDHIALQMAFAVAWVRRTLRRPVLVVGHSAGGHLVAQLMTCRWSDVDPRLPKQVLAGGVAISGLFELDSVRRTPYLNQDLRLSEPAVARLSPAWMPAPRHAGPLLALVGGDESPAFLAQNELIRQAWGASAVPVCEALPGLHHFSVLEALAQPGHRLHDLTLQLLRG